MTNRMALVAVAALALAGCRGGGGTSKTDEGTTVVEAKDASNNPFAALQQVSEGMKKASEKLEAAQKRAPVDPVKFDVLLPYLPEAEGWKAAEPKGETVDAAGFKMSTVSRKYSKGEGDAAQTVDVTIFDSGFSPAYVMPFYMAAQVSQESTDGHTKGVEIGGQPGVETWRKKSNDTELQVLVADRFLLTLKGDNVAPEELRNWVDKVDLNKVASIK